MRENLDIKKIGDLTPEEETSLIYVNYENYPRLMDAEIAIKEGMIEYNNGNIVYRPSKADTALANQGEIIIPSEHRYSLVKAALFGLNEALIRAEQGSKLRDELDQEIEKYISLGEDTYRYGYYAYYPAAGDIVQFVPPKFHRIALIASNSTLYLDQGRKMNWEDVRDTFDKTVVAVAGASVGNGIAHSVAMCMRPKVLKIADPNCFKLSNANRVRLTYRDIALSEAAGEQSPDPLGLQNKAIGAARQMHELDPFIKVWSYFNGIDGDNIKSFIGGNRIEPEASIVIEETDNPDIKVLIREEARRQRKRLVMATDMGSSVQVDIRNFDVNPEATLAFGVSDDELYEAQCFSRERQGDTQAFFGFAEALAGAAYKDSGEFGDLVAGKIPKMFGNLPQLGSTVAVAGGIVAEMIARMSLGYKYPERSVIDLRNGQIQKLGDLV